MLKKITAVFALALAGLFIAPVAANASYVPGADIVVTGTRRAVVTATSCTRPGVTTATGPAAPARAGRFAPPARLDEPRPGGTTT